MKNEYASKNTDKQRLTSRKSHAGATIPLATCDLNKSTAPTQPLTRKRPIEEPVQPPAKRPAARPASQASAPTLRSLQLQLESILTRPQITEEQINAIVEAKLAQQREQFQTALDELHEVCKVGFTNVHTSFEAVADWREEITETFAKIDDWATGVEAKLLATGPSALPKHILSEKRKANHLSSTPAGSTAPLPCQTPAMPPIHMARRRSARISDASEFSLATIPEQPGTPRATGELAEEEEENVFSEDKGSEVVGAVQSAEPASAVPDESIFSESDTLQTQTAVVESKSPAKQVKFASPKRSPVRAATMSPPRAANPENKQPTRTPAAARTLFGTECSTEERFGDTILVDEQTGEVETKLPIWTSRSPSWLKKPVSSSS